MDFGAQSIFFTLFLPTISGLEYTPFSLIVENLYGEKAYLLGLLAKGLS